MKKADGDCDDNNDYDDDVDVAAAAAAAAADILDGVSAFAALYWHSKDIHLYFRLG